MKQDSPNFKYDPPSMGLLFSHFHLKISIQFWFGIDRAGRQILCILLGQRQGPWWSATEKFAMRHVTYTLQPIWHYDPVLLSSFLDGSYPASTSNPFIRIGMPDCGGFVTEQKASQQVFLVMQDPKV